MKNQRSPRLESQHNGRRYVFVLLLSAGFITVFSSTSFSQIGGDENTDLWRVRGNAQYSLPPSTGGRWHADSLYIGATFLRDTTKRFIVWLPNYFIPPGAYKGKLYIMIPRPGLLDSAIFLFGNRCNYPRDSFVDLTNISPNIHHLDTVYFMYRSDTGTTGPTNCGPGWRLPNDYGVKQTDSLFTGPNRAPSGGWFNTDRHYSLRNESELHTITGNPPPVQDTFFSLNKQKYVNYGRRWCAAGWMHRDTFPLPASTIRTDTIEFGFEDQFNGPDMNYEDARFNVTGVFLIHPEILTSLALHLFSKDSIAAGDSTICFAIISGRDSLGRMFKDSTVLANNVAWTLRSSAQSKSVLSKGAGPTNSNIFHPVTAFECDTIIVSYTDPKKGNTLLAKKAIYVMPGPDYRVWIEPDANIDPASTMLPMLTRLRNPSHVPLITMTSSQIVDTVVGVVRDMFGNFTRLASNSQWNEVPITTSMIDPVNGIPAYVGLINRTLSDSGTTKVRLSAKSLGSGADLTSDTTLVKLFISNYSKINYVKATTFPNINTITVLYRNSQSFIFPLSQSLLRSNLSLSLYDLSGRTICRIKSLDIAKPIALNSFVRPGVCCMRLSADGKTIVLRRLLIAR
jgi:hypothetical protein